MKPFLLTTTVLTGLVLSIQPAQAQETGAASAAPAPPAAAEKTVGLEDIVVTAQRRSENLQKAAVPVSAISGDALQAAGITQPTALTSVVPALQIAPAAGPHTLFYLRGVGNFNANALSDSAVAFNFDGVYLGRPSSTTGFFFDLERIEVLKGPQGTLYGRNATGGAINVLSKKPELGKLGAGASIEVGNYSSVRLDGMVNVPLGENAAARVAAIRVRHDGYMNDGTDDQDDWALRGSLRFEPSDDFTINLVGDYFDQRGRGSGATPLLAPQGIPTASAFDPSSRIGFFSPEGQAFYTSQVAGSLGRNFYPFLAGFDQFQKNYYWGVSSTIEWRSSLGTLTIIPAYREGHLDYSSFLPGFQVRQIEQSNQTSVEARFATTEDLPLRAILGAFYYKDKTSDPAVSYVSNWNAQYQRDLKISTESKAIFARLTYAVSPVLRVNAGARQTWDDKSFSGTSISLTRVCFVPLQAGGCPTAPALPFGVTAPTVDTFPGVLVPAFGPAPYGGFPDVVTAPNLAQFATPFVNTQNKRFKKFTWRVGADWDVGPQNLLYASFETGFKSGGFYFSPTAPVTGSYNPETIEAFTIGSKNRFLDNRLQINLELFHWRYKNQQLSHLINIAGVPTFATENVGRATFKGFEIETRFAATDTTTLSADLQYLDAKYDSFVYNQANLNGGVSNGTSCPTSGFATDGSYIVDCSGRRPPNAPKWTLNLAVQQTIPVSFGEFAIDVRTHYQTRTLAGLEFVPVEIQPSYWLADTQLTFNSPGRRYSIGVFVNNIFDKTLISQGFPTPGTDFFAMTLRPPRTYGVRAGVSF